MAGSASSLAPRPTTGATSSPASSSSGASSPPPWTATGAPRLGLLPGLGLDASLCTPRPPAALLAALPLPPLWHEDRARSRRRADLSRRPHRPCSDPGARTRLQCGPAPTLERDPGGASHRPCSCEAPFLVSSADLRRSAATGECGLLAGAPPRANGISGRPARRRAEATARTRC